MEKKKTTKYESIEKTEDNVKSDKKEKIKIEEDRIKEEKTEKKEETAGKRIMQISKALEELRKQKKRKFEQSTELIINLKDFDAKKQSVNLFINVPYKIKKAKICAFLEKKSNLADTIMPADFNKYKEKKEIKKLIRNYDFFIASAKLMPSIASNFGKVLGPAGKMPSPQIGIITEENENNVKTVLQKFDRIARVKTKEPSIKLIIGKESMKNEELEENIKAVYNAVINALPKKRENLKNAMIRFTMTKSIKVEIK